MKISKLVLIFLLFIIGSSCYSQRPKKDEIYIYFKAEDTKMYKVHRGINDTDAYDIFRYRGYKDKSNKSVRYSYVPVKDKKASYKDEEFVKSNVKNIEQLIDVPGFGYYTSDTLRFPFKKVFIAEYIEPNKYKVIQVDSYLGSDY